MSFEWIVFLCLFVVTAIVLALWWFLQIFIVAQSTVSLVLNTSTKQVKLLNTVSERICFVCNSFFF